MKSNKALKLALFFVLSFCLAQATLVLSFAQDTTAPNREESVTLENIYQDRVRTILDNIVSPQDYTLVISATLKNDEGKLKEYEEAVARKFLPGLPINDPTAYSDTNNILLQLKQKVEIQVVLAEHIPADRDGIIKDILKTKLHLSEDGGDTITVVRALRNPDIQKPKDSNLFPELSAKMIAFWILVCMMVLSAVLLWLQRKKEKAEQAERAEQALSLEQKQIESDEEKEPEVASVQPEPVIELTEEQKNELEIKIAHEKAEFLKLHDNYENITTRGVEEFIAQGHVLEAVIVMESLGWNESKRLFKDIDAKAWGKVGNALRSRLSEPSLLEIFSAIHFFHRFALSYVLERTAKEEGNPFSFIFKLNDNQRLDLLKNESAENIALMGVYCSGTQMNDLLKGVDIEKQNEILFHLTQFKQLPETEIKGGVLKLFARLDRIKEDPSVYADGPSLAADFLKNLPAGREEELLSYLLTDHPTEAEKLRSVKVMFQDIPYYPQDITRKVIESLDADDLTKALVGFDADFNESFLGLLPTKRALMIQNDLFHMAEYPPASQCAEMRRKICALIEAEFEKQRFSLADFWKAGRATGDQNTERTDTNLFTLNPDEDDQGKAA